MRRGQPMAASRMVSLVVSHSCAELAEGNTVRGSVSAANGVALKLLSFVGHQCVRCGLRVLDAFCAL